MQPGYGAKEFNKRSSVSISACVVALIGFALLTPATARAAAFDDAGVYGFMHKNAAMMKDARNARAMGEGKANIRATSGFRGRR